MPYVLREWSAPETLINSLADGTGIDASVAATKSSFADFLVKGGVAPAQAAEAADALVHRIIDTLAHGGSPETAIATAKEDIGGVIDHLVRAAAEEGPHSLDQALAQGDPQALARAAHELGVDHLPPEAQKAAITAWQSALANGADAAHAREAALDGAQSAIRAAADGAVELSHGDSLAAHLAGGGPEAAAALKAMTQGLPGAQAAALMNSLTAALAGGSQPSDALQTALESARSAKATGDGQGVPVSQADMLVAALAGGGDVHAALAAAGLSGGGIDAFLNALAGNSGSGAALAFAQASQSAADQALAQASAGVKGSALAAALASGGADAAAALAGMGGDGAGREAFINALSQALASGASLDSALQSADSSASQTAAFASATGSPLMAALASGQNAGAVLAAAMGNAGADGGQAFTAALSNALANGVSVEAALQQANAASNAAESQVAGSSSPIISDAPPGSSAPGAPGPGSSDPGPGIAQSPPSPSSPSSPAPSSSPPLSIAQMLNPNSPDANAPPPPTPTTPDLPQVTPTPPPATLSQPTAPPSPTPPPFIVATGPTILTGMVVDGPIKGARVFVDANNNGVWDTGEYSVLTDASGHFSISADKLAAGRLRTVYSDDARGIDTTTGQVFKVTLSAPLGETNLTGINNLIAAVMDKAGLSKTDAAKAVATAIGAPASVNLLSYDPSSAANQGSELAKMAANLLVIVSGVASTLTGSGAAATDAAMSAAIGAIANQVTSGATLSLTGSSATNLIAAVMADAKTTVGQSATQATVLADTTSNQMVQIISSLVSNITNASSAADVNAATKTALGDASSDLATIAQNKAATTTDSSAAATSNLTNSVDYALAKYTGSGLATTLAAAKTDIANNQGDTTAPSPPVTAADSAATTQNAAITIQVLANDSDPQGKTLSLLNIVHLDSDSSTTKGVITVNADGSVTYNPGTVFNYLAAGQTATDSFGYVVGNGTGQNASGTVTVTVTGTNDAPVFGAAVALAIADTAAADSFATRTGTLSASDVDQGSVVGYGISGGTDNGTTVTLTKSYGTLTVTKASGAYSYVPNAAAINALSASTTDNFTVTASDGTVTTNQTFGVALNGVNDAPTINGATYSLGVTDVSATSAAKLVSTILASGAIGYADSDPGAVHGIEVISAGGSGTWNYLVSGGSWTSFGALGSPLFLTDTTQIEYVPGSPNNETASFTFKAWDATASASDGTLALSANIGTASVQVTGGQPDVHDIFTADSSLNINWTVGGDANPIPNSTNGIVLTPNDYGKHGFVLNNVPFKSTGGIEVTFDYKMPGGTGQSAADGISFFLIDGATNLATFQIGGYGAGLGYTNISGGIIGVGLDEYGGFAGGGSTARPDSIAVYGRTADGNPQLGNIDGTNNFKYVGAAMVGGQHTVDVVMTYNNANSHYYLTMVLGGVTEISGYDLTANGVVMPNKLMFGFAGSTGGVKDLHAIESVTAVVPTAITGLASWTAGSSTADAAHTATASTTPTLVGTGPAGSAISIYDGATLLGTTTADSSAQWSFSPGSALALGAHAFSIVNTTAAKTSATYALTIDASPTVSGTLTTSGVNDNAGASAIFTGINVADAAAGVSNLTADIQLSNSAAGTIAGFTSLGGGLYEITGKSVAQLNTALHAATFTPTNNTGSSGTFTTDFTISVHDQNLAAVSLGPSTVTVTRINDAPVLSVPTAIGYTSVTTATLTDLTGTLSATDPEGTAVTYGISGGTDNGSTVTLVGTYGTLTVTKATGEYDFAPNSGAISGLSQNTSTNYTVTASDGSLSSSQTLTVNMSLTSHNPSTIATPSGSSVGEKMDLLADGYPIPYQITLVTGKTYQFNLDGVAYSGQAALSDPMLALGTSFVSLDRVSLYSAGQALTSPIVAFNDDSSGLNSQIIYNCTVGGTYYIYVSAYTSGVTGEGYDLRVQKINDPPLPPVVEGAAFPQGESVATLFSESHPAQISIAADYAGSDQGRWQYSTDGGANWVAFNTSNTGNTILNATDLLRFLPNDNWNGTPGDLLAGLIDTRGGGIVGYDVISTSVTAVNNAPVASGTATLPTVAENAADPSGATVATLVSANFSDAADAVAGGSVAATFAGIAIVSDGASHDQGAWQYSADHGAHWTAIDTGVSDATALVLSASDEVRFVPGQGFEGAPGALWARLIESGGDQPISGSVVDLSAPGATGGSSHVSADTVNISTSVTPLPEAGDDRALGLDGTAHVEIANAGALKATSAVTLESWVQLAATSGILVDTLSNNAGYRLGIDADGHLQFTVGNGGATTTLTSDGASLADGGWHHLAASYDGSALHLFVDGGDVADAAGVGAGALGASAAATLNLGAGLTGALNDLSIWSVARSQGQIASDLTHSLAGNENGLAGYWKFDEAGGTVANASSAGTPDGTILGGASHLDLSTTVQAAANASVFKGMILGFDAADQSLSYAAANNGDTAFGHVAFSGNTFVYTPTSGHITHDDSFTVAITDADAHTINHSVTVHPV